MDTYKKKVSAAIRLYLAIVLTGMCIMFACKKTDTGNTQLTQQETIEKFLTLPPSTAPEVKRVAAILKSRNERTGFLNTMIKQHGFAIWDKAIIGSGAKKGGAFAKSSNSNDTIAYIPLVLENANHVNAFIYATLNGSVQLRFYRATDYERYGFGSLQDPSKNADKLAMQFMLLDQKVFGLTDFKVLDGRLLKNDSIPSGVPTKDKTVHIEPANSSPNTGGRYEIWTVNVCTTTPYLQCTTNHSCCPDGSCPACQAACWQTKTVCTSFASVVFVDDENWGGGGNGGLDGGTGGGGGSSPTPCNPTPIIDMGILPCTEGNMIGWEPILHLRDEQGFLYTRINELKLKLAANPYELLPCDSLQVMPLDPDNGYGLMYQRVAQFTPPAYVMDRIDSIKNVAFNWAVDNFYMTGINNAYGSVVNCDFFPLRITQLPTGFTAQSLVEYFRKNINMFIDPNLGVSFSPYNDGASFHDTAKFNAPDSASLGALIHIHMLNDGSVIESDYYHNHTVGNERHRIKFTTMATPLDLSHPVAGNREFGIYSVPSVPNEYTFYTMGVDRINDWVFNALKGGTPSENAIFDGADDLWKSFQTKMKDFITTHGGQASLYSTPSITARPKWNDVKDYLKGIIDFQTLKQRLGC